MPIMSSATDKRLEYNNPVLVPTDVSAVCDKTSEGSTTLIIQNTSATSSITFSIDPAAPDQGVPAGGKIPPNDFEPRSFKHNWNGSKLKVSNDSQQPVEMKVTLRDQGR